MIKKAKRRSDQLRPIRITRRFTASAPGAVLIEMGRTKLLCTASLIAEVPAWRKDSQLGWVTAEYSMLPGATSPRKSRARAGHTDNRGLEIQRIVGRVLRSVVDFEKLGPNTIYLDCDVIEADGGTRTAAINGAYIAMVDAVKYGLTEGIIPQDPIKQAVAAVSVGLVADEFVMDLDYALDSNAQVDLLVAMTAEKKLVEIQGTGERAAFDDEQLGKMLNLAKKGIRKIFEIQTECLANKNK